MKNRGIHGVHPDDQLLTREVIGLAMKVHRTLGSGFLESVYRNSLLVEFRKMNIPFEIHPALSVIYEGTEVGVFQADVIVDRRLVVELKAVETLAAAHATQLVNYLAATKIESGLLLNFGASSLEFRTKTLHYRKYPEPVDLQA